MSGSLRTMFHCQSLVYTTLAMINPTQPNFDVTNTNEYRETYANSVQVRVDVWEFFLVSAPWSNHLGVRVGGGIFQGSIPARGVGGPWRRTWQKMPRTR